MIRTRALGTVLVFAVLTAAPAHAEDPPPVDALPSLKTVFTDLFTDIRHVPTVSNGLWLAGAGAAAFAVHEQDRTVTRSAAQLHPLEEFLDTGSPLGQGFVQGGSALATYVTGRLTHHTRLAQLGSELMRAQAINGAITQGIKVAARRSRPDGGRYSFPSGHASATFASATVLSRTFGWRIGVPSYAAASYVAAARLSEHAHFLSDVLFGAGIGIVSGRAVTAGRAHAFAIEPAAVPGGFAVNVVRVERVTHFR